MYKNESRKQKGEAERRPVAFLLLFKSKRLLYLTVTDALLTDVWYKTRPMGINTINTTFGRMKKVTISRIVRKQKNNKSLCSKIKTFWISKM